jgi:hypothetical protein
MRIYVISRGIWPEVAFSAILNQFMSGLNQNRCQITD